MLVLPLTHFLVKQVAVIRDAVLIEHLVERLIVDAM